MKLETRKKMAPTARIHNRTDQTTLARVKENGHVYSIKVNKHLFCTFILLVLLYGSDTWMIKVMHGCKIIKCRYKQQSSRISRDNGCSGLAMFH